MTLVKLNGTLSVNPEQVTSVRNVGSQWSYIEMTTGTRHEVVGTVEEITNILNGVDTQRVTS